MRVQQANGNLRSKPIDAGSTTESASTDNTVADARPEATEDTVTLSHWSAGDEAELGRLYGQYRNSNSRTEQANIRREIEQKLDTAPDLGKTKDLLNRLFHKNDAAWVNKSKTAGAMPDTKAEFGMMKNEVAKGQPLNGNNLFHRSAVQKLKNLAPLVSGEQLFGGWKEDAENDLELLGSRPRALGNAGSSVDDVIKRDLNLVSGAAPKPGLQRQLLNRLV